MKTIRADMSHMQPHFVRNQPGVDLSTTKPVHVERNQRRILAGHVSKFRDEHGNTKYYATTEKDEERLFWSLGGAELFVKLGA